MKVNADLNGEERKWKLSKIVGQRRQNCTLTNIYCVSTYIRVYMHTYVYTYINTSIWKEIGKAKKWDQLAIKMYIHVSMFLSCREGKRLEFCEKAPK